MIIRDGFLYVAGTHKSDVADLPRIATAIRVTVPAANPAVTLAVYLDGDDTSVSLTFLPGYNGWEPVRVRRILSTGTSNDTTAGTEIIIGTAGEPS